MTPETENTWEVRVPTAGGWWSIRRDENNRYNLSFIAIASPRDCEYVKQSFKKLSSLYVYLAKAELDNE